MAAGLRVWQLYRTSVAGIDPNMVINAVGCGVAALKVKA
jgi:hypothetical protein